jgi:hypothetical protein
MPPAQQTAWLHGNYLRHFGVSGSMLHAVPVTATSLLVDVGLFAEANYDAVTPWEHTRQPVLAVWGALDQDHPPEESSRTIREALARGGNPHYTIRFIRDGQSLAHRTLNGGFDHQPSLAPGYAELVTTWVEDLSQGPPAASAEPPPHQDRQTMPLAPPAWYEAGWLQVGALLMLVAGFAGSLLAAAGARLRAPRRKPAVGWSAIGLATTGLAAVVGLAIYLPSVMPMHASGPVVAGRPLPWLALEILSVAALATTAATAAGWWRVRSEVTVGRRVQLGLALATGALFAPWALYWGLLLP